MNGKESGRSNTRAASPLVGIVLLFAFVMIGAMLVFVAGSAMLDAVQSEADRERVQLCASEADHRLETVARTGYDQPFAFDDSRCQPDVVSNGTIEFVWYDNSTEEPPWNDDDRNVSGRLGALEFELDDRTIAHQGGGIWEMTGGETRVVSGPDIGYDGESLRFNIMQLSAGSLERSKPVAKADHSEATELTEKIAEAAASSPEGSDIAVRIESPYYEGWEQYLEDALGEDEYDEVRVTRNGTAVVVRIEGIREPDDEPAFVVADDLGVMGPSNGNGNGNGNGAATLEYENRLPYAGNGANPPFKIGAKIENTKASSHTETVTVTIRDENRSTKLLNESTDVEIPGDGSKTLDGNEFKFTHGQYGDVLEAGETYTYVIETESGDRTDDPPGSFYVGKPGTSFEPSNATATDAGNVTITADIRNVGIENGTENVSLELDYQGELPDNLEDEGLYGDVFEGEINRSFGESDTVELTLNKSNLLDGEYDATVRTADGSDTTSFTVTAGVDPERAGLDDLENSTVEISVLSSQLSRAGLIDHELGTMTLEVVTERDGETTTEHVFENADGGANINTYSAWQDKSDPVYNTTLTIDEEATLTLVSKSYGPPDDTTGCEPQDQSRGIIGDHEWCRSVDTSSTDYLVEPIDATAETREQNLRVRTAEDNDLPALQPGNVEQESVDEILATVSDPAVDRDSLWTEGELDLEENEFLFLFEATTECGMDDAGCDEDDDDIDALWESALDGTGTGDPNFNDLIVYVQVERANVDPGTPSITIQPGGGDTTDVGTGDTAPTESGNEPAETGVEIDTSHVVIG